MFYVELDFDIRDRFAKMIGDFECPYWVIVVILVENGECCRKVWDELSAWLSGWLLRRGERLWSRRLLGGLWQFWRVSGCSAATQDDPGTYASTQSLPKSQVVLISSDGIQS